MVHMYIYIYTCVSVSVFVSVSVSVYVCVCVCVCVYIYIYIYAPMCTGGMRMHTSVASCKVRLFFRRAKPNACILLSESKS